MPFVKSVLKEIVLKQIQKEIMLFTFSAVKYPMRSGVMKPLVPEMQDIIPIRSPAKLGAKSCALIRFVIVVAPLNPIDRVMIAIVHVTSHPVTFKTRKKHPGIMCAENFDSTQYFIEGLATEGVLYKN